MEQEVFTRQELYEMVWTTPLLTLSKKYKISDNGLRKICKRMNIPLPKAGHWMKLQFGKTVNMKSLPVDSYCPQELELSLRKEGEELITDPVKKLTKEIKVEVSERLSSTDPLILAAKARLTGKESAACNFPGMVSCRRDELDIRVTPVNIPRALRIMDAFVKALRTRYHTIHFRNGETYAKVKEEDIKFALHERAKRVVINDRDWGNTEMQPTGLLCFKAGKFTSKEWKDSPTDPLRRVEQFLPAIIAWMEGEADYWNTVREENRREEAARKVKEQEEIKRLEMIRAEEASFERLLADSERWDQVRKLRAFIDEVERRGKLGPDARLPKFITNPSASPFELEKWVEWARGKAEEWDPFGGG